MPKKKQVTFESNVTGKFIPREDQTPVSASASASQDHRYNGKMAELLANSCDSTNETSKIGQVSPERKEEKIETSRPSSRPFHRRIVTALETLRRRGSSNSNTKAPKVSPSTSPNRNSSKSQPITFGQLREASSSIQNEDSVEPVEKNDENVPMETVSPSVEEILENFYSKIQMENVSSKQNWTNAVFVGQTPPILLNEQNRTRPPPPSYSSSVANFPRAANVHSNPFFIRPTPPMTLVEQFYPHLSNNTNVNVRPAPPPYETSNIEQQVSNEVSNNGPGFDREFSRLLYGKDSARTRQKKPKRKALSDPVKKSVEEAGRSAEKTHRRLTAHVNRRDTVKEEEETNSDSNELEKPTFQSFLPPRRPPRNSQRFSNRRQSSRNAIVPANPVLNKPIPQFLRVYSQAPSSNDILLQWHLFALEELESFEAMITKLYKDETFSCIQPFENYRLALISQLEKKSFLSRTEDEDDSLTTSL